ncbi:TniQ family protein [Aquitalea denitrificans]|uniref:TniQ family protein n=1 Tax=Aquitalea denitrificans TaxID=519081 RepID=UPI0013581960|nr:TniQ family protein [Aquitalea denitrificans]
MTRTPTLLVARPKPIRLESFLGYCLRLGEANGFLDLKWLRPMVAKYGNPLHPAIGNLTLLTGHAADLLSLLNGPAPAALGQSSDWRLGLKITYWNHGHRRWCPQCLEENGYWKSEWLLSLQVACPTHQRLLHEACPACRHHVSYLHGSLYCCPCGADLRQALPVPANTRQLSIAAHLSRAFQRVVLRGKREHHAEYHPHPLLAPLHLAQLCDLLWVFGAYALHRPGVKPQKIANHGQIAVIQPFIAMAMHILEGWPNNFHRLLEEYTKPTAGQTASLRIYLQEIHQALSRLLVHPELQFLRHEFEQHVHTRWQDKLILKDELRKGHPIMSGAEAAQRLKLPVRALHKLVEQGEIKGCKVVSAQGKTSWMVERASVELFAQNEHDLLTMKDVESLLRITPNRIRLLAENHLLEAAPRPSDRAPWLFKHSDVNAFLERLNHSNLSITPESTSLISVWEITKRWMQGREAFLAVIRALIDGDLQVESRTPAETGIRALLVSREQFRDWHQQYRLSRGFFTVPEAAKHLKMDLNLLYQLISKELVQASPQQYGYEKKMLMGIFAEELERIDSSYVWGKKLGALLGLSEHSAAKALLHQGIRPICGPTIDNVGCYLFRCSDVLAAFAEAHAFNRTEGVL